MSIATLWNYSTSSLSRRIIAAMLALTLSACSDDFEPTGEPISGSVQNYFTGQNLPNATIVATRNDNGSSVELGRTVTDSEGEYTIFVNPEITGRIGISVQADNFARHSIVLNNPTEKMRLASNILLQPVFIDTDFDPTDPGSFIIFGSNTEIIYHHGNSFVDANGSVLSDDIHAEITITNLLTDPDVLPGDYLAIDSSGNTEFIESFGVISAVFTDQTGAAVYLGAGDTAQISIPLAASQNPSTAPLTLPLYYFDYNQHYWVEDGAAVLTQVGTSIWVYIGTVTHFGTWNAGRVYETSFFNGCVENTLGERVAGAQIVVTGGSTFSFDLDFDVEYRSSSSTTSDEDGLFKIPTKSNSSVLISTKLDGPYSTLEGPSSVLYGQTYQSYLFSADTDQEYNLPDCVIIHDATDITVTLTWGATLTDLDARLIGPDGNDGEFNLSFDNQLIEVNESVLSLDIDDRNRFGPETITLANLSVPGTYQYRVVNYSGSGDLATPARVALNILGQTIIFAPPAGTPQRTWNVFNIIVDDALNVSVENIQSWGSNIDTPVIFKAPLNDPFQILSLEQPSFSYTYGAMITTNRSTSEPTRIVLPSDYPQSSLDADH